MSGLPAAAHHVGKIACHDILHHLPGVFELFEKHSDVIQRVTAWGLTDRGSWKNNFPVPGRKDYPLLIGRDGQPKPFVLELIDEAQKNQNNTH